jgi:ABC-type antimicrobial peptide transport system permease subunit
MFYATDVAASIKSYTVAFAIRTSRDATVLTESIRKAIVTALPDSPPPDIKTGAQIIATDLGRERLGAWFFSGFGLVALILGVGGVFGLVGYLTTSRRREMGVRLALGARHGQVSQLIVFAGLKPVIIGTVIGLGAAALLANFVDALLIGMERFDPLIYLAAAAVMLLVAAAAGIIAAWRIRHLSPTEILRAE